MSFTVQQVASNIVTDSGTTIAATFASAIQAGEAVGVIATYVGAVGAGTCADPSGAYTQGATVAGVGWTKTSFYKLNHAGGQTVVTFTAPSAITNKGIVAFRISATGTISFASSICTTQAAPGTGANAITTGSLTVSSADALIVAACLDTGSSNTLSVGTSFTTQGTIWGNYGLAESRAITASAAATFTTSGGSDSFLTGGLAFQVSSAVSHPSTGALTAQAATVAGTGATVHLHPSTGALAADPAVVAGTGTRFGLRPSTGALVAQAATVAGTGARVREHASTGALVAGAAVVAGAGAVVHKHPSTGALAAGAAVVAGTGTRFGLRPSTGALVAQAAVVAGAGATVHLHPSTGALVAGEATVAGTGTVSAAGTFPSTGVLVAQEAVVAGVGTVSHVHASTGALVAGEATLAGVAATPSTPALLFAAGASAAQRKKQVSANPAEYNSPTEAAAVKPVMLPVQTAAEADAEDAEIVGLLVSLAAAGFFSEARS